VKARSERLAGRTAGGVAVKRLDPNAAEALIALASPERRDDAEATLLDLDLCRRVDLARVVEVLASFKWELVRLRKALEERGRDRWLARAERRRKEPTIETVIPAEAQPTSDRRALEDEYQRIARILQTLNGPARARERAVWREALCSIAERILATPASPPAAPRALRPRPFRVAALDHPRWPMDPARGNPVMALRSEARKALGAAGVPRWREDKDDLRAALLRLVE
jgi:hypothetical protein